LYEVYKKVKIMKGEEMALEAVAALSQTKVVPIDQTLSLEAADYSLEYDLHFADALVYATARRFSAELHTSDEDLKGLPGISFV
jgi:toxin FitB